MAILEKGGYIATKALPPEAERLLIQPEAYTSGLIRPDRATVEVGTAPQRMAPVQSTPREAIREEPGFFKSAVEQFKQTDKAFTAQTADVFNVTPKTVNTVGLISLIGTGAGLLANGVKSLFDGTLKAKRAEKKAANAAANQAEGTKAAQALAASFMRNTAKATGGGVAQPGSGGMMEKAMPFLQKNWMWLAIAGLVLFGGKLFPGLFKPKRTYRRRPAKPKTVIRYRTRKAPARRRR